MDDSATQGFDFVMALVQRTNQDIVNLRREDPQGFEQYIPGETLAGDLSEIFATIDQLDDGNDVEKLNDKNGKLVIQED